MGNDADVLPVLPKRAADSHKGTFGHALVIAGSPGMAGAGLLAARAAQRGGAGLVTLAVPEGLGAAVSSAAGSLMTWPLPEAEGGVLGMSAAHALADVSDRFTAFAVGPGLRTGPETCRMVQQLAWELLGPLVIDADGLNALAVAGTEVIAGRAAPAVLTPHPGEMARLMGLPGASHVQHDREGLAVQLAVQTGAVVVLKGSGTVVTDGQRTAVNETGNPGMASGGMGDVLTGLITGFLCQGLDPYEAARLAVFAHGLAGDLGAAHMGELSLIAEDVLDCLPAVLTALVDAGEGAKPADVAAGVLGE